MSIRDRYTITLIIVISGRGVKKQNRPKIGKSGPPPIITVRNTHLMLPTTYSV